MSKFMSCQVGTPECLLRADGMLRRQDKASYSNGKSRMDQTGRSFRSCAIHTVGRHCLVLSRTDSQTLFLFWPTHAHVGVFLDSNRFKSPTSQGCARL